MTIEFPVAIPYSTAHKAKFLCLGNLCVISPLVTVQENYYM